MCGRKTSNILEVHRDMLGRYIMCKIEINDDTYGFVNVYAPNISNKVFFTDLFQDAMDIGCDFYILGGDFNLVFDLEKDCTGSILYNMDALKRLKSLMEINDLIDIWRALNPETQKFTWFGNRPNRTYSRIDYFLTSNCLLNNTINAEILPGFMTDHSLITFVIDVSKCKRGPGIWRLNNPLLDNNKYCELIREEINCTLKCSKHLDAQDTWELLKLNVAQKSREFSKKRVNTKKVYKVNLYKLLESLQEEAHEHGISDELKKVTDSVEADLESIYHDEAVSSAFRAKAKYTAEGDKCTRYFLLAWKSEIIYRKLCIKFVTKMVN